MNSTLNSDAKEIVRVKDVTMSFPLTFYHNFTARDLFVDFVKSPIKTLLKPSEFHYALQHINLTVFKGDRLGIIGVNGAGKTSLCRTIAGMYHPQKGSIDVSGEVRAIFDTSIGIMPDLTGRENAELLAELLFAQYTDKERAGFVEDALSFSELENFIDIPFRNYSKGMQSRLCLSLISAKSSDLLILDEVFDGADEFFQVKIAKRVMEMIEKSGAVIFVSHSVDQVRKACNRLIVLDHGKLVFDGDVEEGIKKYHEINVQE